MEDLVDEERLLLAGLLVGLEVGAELRDRVGLGEDARQARDDALDGIAHARDDDLRAALLGLHRGQALVILVRLAAAWGDVRLDVVARILDRALHDLLHAVVLEGLELLGLKHYATPPAARESGRLQSDWLIMWFSLTPITPIRMASAPCEAQSWSGCGLMV